ncbi:MAG TPA: FtsX-like permease family protein [Vicinamibacterales bacterium]|nr:FtsX-like permease family protein [Vicinamibacterales bacterium]
MRAINRKLLRDLLHIRSQAIAIALVIGAGVAMYVLMLSTFDSLALTQHTYYQRYRFADVFASLKRAPLWLTADIARIPGVAQVDTRVVVDVTLDVPGVRAPVTGRLISIPEEHRPVLNGLALLTGRWIDPGRSDEIIANEKFANANHLTVGDTIGAVINGRRRELRIVGLALSPEYVYAVKPGELVGDDARFGILWMGRRALATAFQMEGGFNDVSLSLMPGASPGDVIARLDRLLAPYGGLGAIPRARQLSHFFLQSELDSLHGIGRIVPIIFLLVAAFLLHIVLSRIVTIQRQEIAALKALGYGDWQVAWHYVELSLLVGTAGAVAGVLAGAWMGRGMTQIYTQFFQFPLLEYRLPPAVVIQALAVGDAAAVLSALGAAHRILRLPPAEAMRPEPPAVYRVSLFERAGLRRWLSQPTRIVLRNIQRHPGRSLLSAVGIAFGGAIMVVGLFTIDSFDFMMNVQFNLSQLYNAMVTFVEPVSASAAQEVDRLPGVMQAEPFRSVPVKIIAGPRSRHIAITGLPSPSRLNRIIDASLRVVTLPPDGLVLSTKLADVLHVRPGDRVTLDVLEGARPTRQVVVNELVDQFIGMNAYMRLSALHRLLHEGDSLSGAFLRTDPRALDRLYRTLKATPKVAGVTLKSAERENYERTISENIGITRTVTIIFALIIAFGVVYNTSRIALSERARELGTLRVIGFSRPEVAYILLGELTVITLAALPLSLLLGYGLAASVVGAYDTEVYRIPLIFSARTCLEALATTVVAAIVSGWLVRRRLNRLDLIAVLKTRE